MAIECYHCNKNNKKNNAAQINHELLKYDNQSISKKISNNSIIIEYAMLSFMEMGLLEALHTSS